MDSEDSKKEQDITGDGGVLKKILKEGSGWKNPPKGSEVKVHYVGKLLDGTVFDSSRERNQEFEFKLGENSVIAGWEKGIASMKKDELALFTIKPQYAYGEAGSPPKIPTNATLQFEVELISWIDEKDITEGKDGGVLKKVIKEGENWEKPKEDTKVKVSYVVRLEDGYVVDKKDNFEFVVGAEEVLLGLDIAVQDMKKGEKAELTIKSEYGYGTSGNELLKVPSQATLKCEIELVDFEKEKSSWDMSTDEKLEVATKKKTEGNSLYSQQKYQRAIKKYKQALNFLEGDSQFEDNEKEKSKALKIPCYLNTAICMTKTNEFRKAVENCNKALELDKNNVKALFRRGVAYSELDEWDLAEDDFNKAKEIDPHNKEIILEQQKLKKKITEQNKKDKKFYGAIFEKMSKRNDKSNSANQAPSDKQTETTPMEVDTKA